MIILIILLLTGIVYAGEISSPPPLSTEPVQEQHYLREIYENINRFDVVTSAPDGTLKGKKGQPVIYNNGGTLELWINYDGELDWQKI